MRYRYGLEDGNEHTLKECGERLGVHKETARLLQKSCLKKLREASNMELSDSADKCILFRRGGVDCRRHGPKRSPRLSRRTELHKLKESVLSNLYPDGHVLYVEDDDDGEPDEVEEGLPEADFSLGKVSSIVDVLDPLILNDEELLVDIRTALLQGKLVVVRNAFRPKMADYVWDLMNDEAISWEEYTVPWKTTPHFKTSRSITHDLDFLVDRFEHKISKEFFEQLSGRSCATISDMHPTWMKPKDFSNPLSTFKEDHSLYFSWHLKKDGSLTDGGAHTWHPAKGMKSKYIDVKFNDLLLYIPRAKAVHSINPVAFWAENKRFSIDGWCKANPNSTPTATNIEDNVKLFSTAGEMNALTFKQASTMMVDVDTALKECIGPREELLDLKDRVEEYLSPEDKTIFVINSN